MKQATKKTAAIKGESMSRKLPNGELNPEYWKWYYAKRKAEGRPIPPLSPEKQREYRAKRKAEGRPIPPWSLEKQREYRAKRKAEGRPVRSKDAIKLWNQSEKGKAAFLRYRVSDQGKAAAARYRASKTRGETPDDYAARIIREVERISLNDYERA